MNLLRASLAHLVVACLAVVLPPAADADTLVLVDGTRIETRGAYEVEGRRVTFTDAKGRLSMLRLSEVDLEASRRANEAPPPEAAANAREEDGQGGRDEPARPVLVLTNADIGPGSSDPDSAAPTAQVLLFTTDWCGVCRRAKALLDEWKIEYEERNVEKDPIARDEAENRMPECGGVPVIDVGGQFMCGLDPKRLAKMLRAAGHSPEIKKTK